jgi:site-specific recombinase XerD
MSPRPFHSCLADHVQRFIDLRCLAGTDYHSQAQLLGYFDRFLDEQGVTEPWISREITDAYQHSLRHLRPRTQDNRCSVVRQFCEYLSRTDPRCYVPERQRATRAADARVHHIYSLSEVQSLLAAAARLPPVNSLRPHTHRTLLGLLYCTGLRVGEAFALNLEDFHDDAPPRLYIAQGKFRKARWVPLSDSASQALRHYVHRRQTFGPGAPDSPLFLSQRSGRLHHSAVYRTFRQLLSQCGVPHHPDSGPRLHDLRHTFAVHRLLAWYRDGQDVNSRLAWLATYLGHVDIQSTQVYLHATAELLAEVDRRFYHHYLQHVKSLGEAV